jgi:hypothetical protein
MRAHHITPAAIISNHGQITELFAELVRRARDIL